MSTHTRLTGLPLEAWAGEIRVNLLRLVGLLIYYAHHLLRYYVLKDDPGLTPEYHQAVTALVVAWGGMVGLIHILCRSQLSGPDWTSSLGTLAVASGSGIVFKPWMKYAITVMDLLFIYTLVLLHPEGPRGPMVLLLFLVIASAPLRLSLRLVYVATLGAMLTYVLVVGTLYIRLGSERYYAAENVKRVPRPTQAVMLLTLGGAGLFAGQMVRQSKRLAARSEP
jgi:hypothetical protein